MMRSHHFADFRQRPQHWLHKKIGSIFLRIKTFSLWVSLKIVNICFSQSALRIFDSTLCRFPGSWLEVATHHVLLLSQHCIAYWMSAWSKEMEPALFQNTVEWKQVSMFFILDMAPAKNSTPPKVVFMYANSNTLTLRLRNGNKSQWIVNLTPIQGIWFYHTTINNASRLLSIAIGEIRESSHIIWDAAKSSKQCFPSIFLLLLLLISKKNLCTFLKSWSHKIVETVQVFPNERKFFVFFGISLSGNFRKPSHFLHYRINVSRVNPNSDWA